MISITTEDIQENIDTVEILGKGNNGIALKITINDKQYVLKITKSKEEFDISLKLKKLQTQNNDVSKISAQVYTAGKTSSLNISYDKSVYKYFILAEYLIVTPKIKKFSEKNLYGKLFTVCINSKVTLSQLLTYNKNELYAFFKKYYDSTDKFELFTKIVNILKLHKNLKSNDFHSGNIGIDLNGNIKAYDFDVNKNRKHL